jgi:hypothetical protein
MNHHPILDVGIVANGNGVNIAPHHGIEPNRAIITQRHLAYHHGIVGQKAVLSEFWGMSPHLFD